MPSSPPSGDRTTVPPAGLLRRLASLVYESLITVALSFAVGFAFFALRGLLVADAPMRVTGAPQGILPATVLIALGFYYVWCWRRGQTLAMKTWRLRIVEARRASAGEAGIVGVPVSLKRAILRYALAAFVYGTALVGGVYLREHPAALEGWLALLPLTLTLAWPLWDREGQFLHDRLAGTFLVRSNS